MLVAGDILPGISQDIGLKRIFNLKRSCHVSEKIYYEIDGCKGWADGYFPWCFALFMVGLGLCSIERVFVTLAYCL